METNKLDTKTNEKEDYAPLPELDGFSFYRFTGSENDYENIVALVNAQKDEPDFYNFTTLKEIKRDYEFYAKKSGWDLKRDVIFVKKDEQVLACCRSSEEKVKGQNRWEHYTMFNILPTAWDTGLPEVLLTWSEAQARARHKVHHAGVSGEHRYFCIEKLQKKVDLAKKCAYQPIRYWDTMVHKLETIPHYALPEGLELRAPVPSQYRKIWDAINEAFQDHWGMTEQSEEDYQEWVGDHEYFQPNIYQVAWSGDEIAGAVGSWIIASENEVKNRARAVLTDIAVRRSWRGIGLAKALTSRALEMFKLLNMKEVSLEVDTENPSGAYDLYEALGFVFEKRGISWMKPLIE